MENSAWGNSDWNSKPKETGGGGWGSKPNNDDKQTTDDFSSDNGRRGRPRQEGNSFGDPGKKFKDSTNFNNNGGGIFEVFFCGASYDAGEDDLRNHFKDCGEIVQVKILMRDGKTSGRGFVKFSEESAQKKALDLNESEFMGRSIRVELPRNSGGGGGGKKQGGRPHEPGEENSSIMVRNLAYAVEEEDLEKLFSKCGEIRGKRIVKDDEGKSRGFGFVDFNSIEDAKKAVAMHGTDCKGRSITVVFSRKKERSDGGNREDREDRGNREDKQDKGTGDFAW